MSNAAHMGERKGAFRVLVGKPDGKRLLVRPRCRWDNIKTYSRKRMRGVNWIDMPQDGNKQEAHLNKVMDLQAVP